MPGRATSGKETYNFKQNRPVILKPEPAARHKGRTTDPTDFSEPLFLSFFSLFFEMGRLLILKSDFNRTLNRAPCFKSKWIWILGRPLLKSVLHCVVCKYLCCFWECIAVCCSMLQCVAVCCSALQCVAVWSSVSHCFVCEYLCCFGECAEACCSVLQCAAACCNVLQCVAVFHSVLRVALCCK